MNSTNMNDYITRSAADGWQPLLEKGIDTTGLYIKTLRYDEENNRPPTFLLKFEPGASYPYHNHPAGEEIFVLDGEARIEGHLFRKGDYLYTPPGFKHAVTSTKGCELLLMVPEEVEILTQK